MEQLRAGHLEHENSKASMVLPFAAKLSEAHRQRGDCSKSIHPDWVSEAWSSSFIYKIMVFSEVLNFLHLCSWADTYKCVYMYKYVYVYMCLLFKSFYLFGFFFCLYIPHQACDADPELEHHQGLNKYDSIGFNWAKEGYVKWGSVILSLIFSGVRFSE